MKHRMVSSGRIAILALVALLLGTGAALGQWPTFTVREPYDWEVSAPEEQGVDPAIVTAALEAGEALPYLNALLVVRNGVLIGERYYGDTRATDANTVLSVSKSFLSALVGIAIRDGYLTLDQPIMDSFPEYVTANMDPRKLEITIRHLLTMTSGLPYDDHDEHWSRWMPSSDWVGFCIGLPLDDNPGEAWHYSTCSTHIMSALLTRAVGMSTLEFAHEHLFQPLGIVIGGWRLDPQGYYRGGWDMYFTPRDLARFGHLYRKKGKLEGRRMIPRKWVRKTTRTNVRGGSWGPMDRWGYGHWWWTGRGADIHKMYFALGYGGQFVINIPKMKMTIVATANANYGWEPAGQHVNAILDLIGEYLLEPLEDSGIR
ncbi:MAG: serine hydrolase [bacterium]|nr:serine hydrolase [bacterium]